MASEHPQWAQDRLLQFLNSVQSAEEIYQNPDLQDDPESGSKQGYVIGEKTAENILTHRSSLPRRRFESTDQVLDVPGLGEDKLNDLVHSFAIPADDAFVEALFAGPLGENWEVTPHVLEYASDAEFNLVADHAESFRRAVAPLYSNILSYYSNEAKRELEIRIHGAHQENYFESHLGSFPFAYWWYLFDQDNWFSYETMRGLCEDYLGYHGNDDRTMQFRMIHLGGYDSISDHRRFYTLPVVVNYPELRITLWSAELRD